MSGRGEIHTNTGREPSQAGDVIFTGAPTLIATLNSKFALNEEVFRVIFTDSPEIKPAK